MSEKIKPKVKLIGLDGNAFFIIARVSQALRKAGMIKQSEQYRKEAMSGDYDNLLQVSMKFVDVY